MEAYKTWIRRNKYYVHSLESLANGLTWLLPERFSDSEIGPEAVTAILGIFTAINEHIIDTTPTQIRPGCPEPSSFPYSLCVTLLTDIETLVEVVAQHVYGDDKKWNFIAVTEAAKVCVRLALFRNNGYKMLLSGGETSNVGNDSDDLDTQRSFGHLAKHGPSKGPNNSKNYQGQNAWNLEGKALSALNRFGENARMVSEPTWLRRVQHQRSIMEPPMSVEERPTVSTILTEKGLSGAFFLMREVMFITRPLIYVLLIRKYGVRSWFPWCTSLSVDLIGVGILSHVATLWRSKKDQRFHFSTPEKDELKRRKLLWALYLMRDPFFSKYSRQRLESTEKLLEPVPIIGFLTAKVIELIIGAQTRYTYMSGS